VFWGLIVDVPLAIAASEVLRGLLFPVHASDPATYIAITALLLGTALLAAYIPARRANKIAPAMTLKYE
jgi:putative ABC transport system permease protein